MYSETEIFILCSEVFHFFYVTTLLSLLRWYHCLDNAPCSAVEWKTNFYVFWLNVTAAGQSRGHCLSTDLFVCIQKNPLLCVQAQTQVVVYILRFRRSVLWLQRNLFLPCSLRSLWCSQGVTWLTHSRWREASCQTEPMFCLTGWWKVGMRGWKVPMFLNKWFGTQAIQNIQ